MNFFKNLLDCVWGILNFYDHNLVRKQNSGRFAKVAFHPIQHLEIHVQSFQATVQTT